jgi:hypothetical protein
MHYIGDEVTGNEEDREVESIELIDAAEVEDRRSNAVKVSAAIYHLRQARDLLKAAGAKRTVDRVRLALTSAGGAERHAKLQPYRTQRRKDVLAMNVQDAPGTDTPPPLFDGYDWTMRDQLIAQKSGWELSQFSDDQICIVAAEDTTVPQFVGPSANIDADAHVRLFSNDVNRANYAVICRRAVTIADESFRANNNRCLKCTIDLDSPSAAGAEDGVCGPCIQEGSANA